MRPTDSIRRITEALRTLPSGQAPPDSTFDACTHNCDVCGLDGQSRNFGVGWLRCVSGCVQHQTIK
jgi:hypothetical protein